MITANIETEIQTIAEYIAPLFTAVRGQNLPKVYVPDTCVVRYLGDDQESETGASNRIDRQYQLVFFGATEIDCIRKVNSVQQYMTNIDSLKLKGSTRYMRMGSFSTSAPFLTENKVVYAVIGVLQVQVRQAKEVEKYPIIGGVVIRPVGDPTQTEIVVGKDCRIGEM